MQSLNILIAGEGLSLELFKNSKFLKKLYITSENEVSGAINLKFNTFKELALKCKSLQIDIVFVENEKWILQGIADVLKKNYVNCIAPVSQWAKLAIDYRWAREQMDKFGIKHPAEYSFPKIFPLVVRAGSFSKTVYSMAELLSVREEINSFPEEIIKETFIEELLDGELIKVSSLYDGKHLISYPQKELNPEQQEALYKYNRKLEKMLRAGNAEFIGFLSSNLVLGKELYNKSFGLEFPKLDKDILFVLINAIYQKLDEIDRL